FVGPSSRRHAIAKRDWSSDVCASELLFEDYQQNLKREKKFVLSWQILILISFFGIWELASGMYWIDPLIFSSPSEIYGVLVEKFADGSMVTHLQVTLFETVLGFLIGTILGIIMATV